MPRRSRRQKEAIATLNIMGAVSKSLGAFNVAMDSPDISDLDKAKLAVPVITKHMVNKVEGEINQNTILTFSWGSPDGQSN